MAGIFGNTHTSKTGFIQGADDQRSWVSSNGERLHEGGFYFDPTNKQYFTMKTKDGQLARVNLRSQKLQNGNYNLFDEADVDGNGNLKSGAQALFTNKSYKDRDEIQAIDHHREAAAYGRFSNRDLKRAGTFGGGQNVAYLVSNPEVSEYNEDGTKKSESQLKADRQAAINKRTEDFRSNIASLMGWGKDNEKKLNNVFTRGANGEYLINTSVMQRGRQGRQARKTAGLSRRDARRLRKSMVAYGNRLAAQSVRNPDGTIKDFNNDGKGDENDLSAINGKNTYNINGETKGVIDMNRHSMNEVGGGNGGANENTLDLWLISSNNTPYQFSENDWTDETIRNQGNRYLLSYSNAGDIDADHDHIISKAEWDKWTSEHGKSNNGAINSYQTGVNVFGYSDDRFGKGKDFDWAKGFNPNSTWTRGTAGKAGDQYWTYNKKAVDWTSNGEEAERSIYKSLGLDEKSKGLIHSIYGNDVYDSGVLNILKLQRKLNTDNGTIDGKTNNLWKTLKDDGRFGKSTYNALIQDLNRRANAGLISYKDDYWQLTPPTARNGMKLEPLRFKAGGSVKFLEYGGTTVDTTYGVPSYFPVSEDSASFFGTREPKAPLRTKKKHHSSKGGSKSNGNSSKGKSDSKSNSKSSKDDKKKDDKKNTTQSSSQWDTDYNDPNFQYKTRRNYKDRTDIFNGQDDGKTNNKTVSIDNKGNVTVRGMKIGTYAGGNDRGFIGRSYITVKNGNHTFRVYSNGTIGVKDTDDDSGVLFNSGYHDIDDKTVKRFLGDQNLRYHDRSLFGLLDKDRIEGVYKKRNGGRLTLKRKGY